MLMDEDLDSFEKRRAYTVTVVGCGRKGLPTACLLAEAGFKVFCLDTDQYIIERLMRGFSPFDEPGLKELIRRNLKAKRLEATTRFEDTIPISDIVSIAVPVLLDHKMRPDYLQLETACRDVGLNMKAGTLIMVMSTLIPGTTETLIKETLETASGLEAGKDFGLAYSPVQVTAGRALNDITSNPRVLGAIDEVSLKAAKAVLRTFSKGGVIEVKDIKTAESLKLFEAVYRDVNMALANELSYLCEKMGIDFLEVMRIVNSQPHCHLTLPEFTVKGAPKDPYLLMDEADNLRVRLRVVTASRRVNEEALKRVLRLLREALRSCGKPAKRARILILGVSYRPNLREVEGSIVRDLVEMLQNKGMRVKVYDPLFSYSELIKMGYPAEKTLTRAAKDMDCLLITVGHDRFKRLNLRRLKIAMRKPAVIVDLGRVLNCEEVEKAGFIYRGLGRGARQSEH